MNKELVSLKDAINTAVDSCIDGIIDNHVKSMWEDESGYGVDWETMECYVFGFPAPRIKPQGYESHKLTNEMISIDLVENFKKWVEWNGMSDKGLSNVIDKMNEIIEIAESLKS